MLIHVTNSDVIVTNIAPPIGAVPHLTEAPCYVHGSKVTPLWYPIVPEVITTLDFNFKSNPDIIDISFDSPTTVYVKSNIRSIIESLLVTEIYVHDYLF